MATLKVTGPTANSEDCFTLPCQGNKTHCILWSRSLVSYFTNFGRCLHYNCLEAKVSTISRVARGQKMRNNQGIRRNKCFLAYWLPLPILTCTSPKQEHRNTCMVQQIYLQIVTHKCTSQKVRGNSVTFHLSLLKLHPAALFYQANFTLFGGKKLSSIPNATNRYSQKSLCKHRVECLDIINYSSALKREI